jgi:hypothetical protein
MAQRCRLRASNNIWAVGATGTTALIHHWNGTAWSSMSSPNPPGATSSAVSSVKTFGASSAWAVGNAAVPGGNPSNRTLIQRWNGASWTRVASPARTPFRTCWSPWTAWRRTTCRRSATRSRRVRRRNRGGSGAALERIDLDAGHDAGSRLESPSSPSATRSHWPLTTSGWSGQRSTASFFGKCRTCALERSDLATLDDSHPASRRIPQRDGVVGDEGLRRGLRWPDR